MLYPMKMIPAFKDYLWGGVRLREEYGKKTSLDPVAESWEISCHPDGPSAVENGPLAGQALAEILSGHPDWMGTHCRGMEFPLLVKLIDARESLSVQVHPGDEYARRVEGQQGKNEMWYVLDALPGAELVLGLERPADPGELGRRLDGGGLAELLRRVPVKAGDCYQIPAGMLHAIGAGVLVAEIQQNSNITYRVYDYDRRGPDGNPRPLHVDKALEVIDPALVAVNTARRGEERTEGGCRLRRLADWRFFQAERAEIPCGGVLEPDWGPESFHCVLVTDGALELAWPEGCLPLAAGESALVPAGMGRCRLTGEGGALLAWV